MSDVPYFHSWGYSQSAPKKMSGASGLAAFQMPHNNMSKSIAPQVFQLPEPHFLSKNVDMLNENICLQADFPLIILSTILNTICWIIVKHTVIPVVHY